MSESEKPLFALRLVDSSLDLRDLVGLNVYL